MSDIYEYQIQRSIRKVYPSIHLSNYLSFDLSFYLSIYYLSIYLSIYLSTYLYKERDIHIFTSLFNRFSFLYSILIIIYLVLIRLLYCAQSDKQVKWLAGKTGCNELKLSGSAYETYFLQPSENQIQANSQTWYWLECPKTCPKLFLALFFSVSAQTICCKQERKDIFITSHIQINDFLRFQDLKNSKIFPQQVTMVAKKQDC